MAITSTLGILEFRVRYGIGGKTSGFSLYAGMDPTAFPLSDIDEYALMNQFLLNWNDEVTEEFTKATLAGLFTPGVTGITAELYAKLSTTREVVGLPVPTDSTGTRSAGSLGARLPLQNTISCYAPKLLVEGRGSKVAFAEAFEFDWESGGWSAAASTKFVLVTNFLLAWSAFLTDFSADAETAFFRVVVPRLKLPKEDEGFDYRLPYESGDIPNAVQVGAFVPSQQAGTKDKLSPKLR